MDRVREIVAEATGIPIDQVTDDIGFGLHPQWDSVAQISVVMSLEEAFGIQISDDDIATLTTVPGILTFLSGRLSD